MLRNQVEQWFSATGAATSLEPNFGITHSEDVVHSPAYRQPGRRHHHTPTSFPDVPSPVPVAPDPTDTGASSTTDSMEGEGAQTTKLERELAPPPGHPLFLQSPAIRAALYANIAKKKYIEALDHARTAMKEAETADSKWFEAKKEAATAAAASKMVFWSELKSSLVRSLNRQIGFSVRSQQELARGGNATGSMPFELSETDYFVKRVQDVLTATKTDIGKLNKLIEDLEHEMEENQYFRKGGGEGVKRAVNGPLVLLQRQEQELTAVFLELQRAHRIIKAQYHEPELQPPVLPKRLLDPDGVPYWPNKPPKPEADRGMLVKFEHRPPGVGPYATLKHHGAQFL